MSSQVDHEGRMREALHRIAAPASASSTNAYDQVLQRSKEILNENPAVQAEIEERSQPPMRFLVTHPKHRRSPQASMLSFGLIGTSIKVLGEGRPELRTPDELWDYLVDFLEKPDFPITLKEYEEMEKEEVEGHLRKTSLFDRTREDVLVAVPPDQQRRLAEARPREELTLTVRLEHFHGFGTYDQDAKYACLESAGYGLRIIEHKRSDELLRLTGTVMAVDELY